MLNHKKMLNQWVEAALTHRWTVLGITLLLVISGIAALIQLPIDAVPDITNVQVVVNTKTGALDPEKIEAMVTRPIEVEMGGIPHLEEVRSISKYGLSQVTLVFEDGTNIYWARQQVAERLSNINKELPTEATSELAPITTGLGEVFMYSVEDRSGQNEKKKSLAELRFLQDYQIRPILKRIPGVADVDSNGGFQKEMHINFFPDRLEKWGISLSQLEARLETLGDNFGGGYIQQKGEQIIVRTVPGLNHLDDLKMIPIGTNIRGGSILLRDVADIREDHALRVGAATKNGEEIVLGTVLMQTGANSRKVAMAVERAVQELKLPEGVQIIPLYSRSFLVNATIHTVVKNLVEGAALVVLVLLLLLGNLRAALIVAMAIPISMLIAVRGMTSLGISASLMSLGAIDFGLLVDGSVVLIENILRGSIKGSGGNSLTDVRERVCEVIHPVVFGLLMIMLVYVPILTLEGIEGKMFKPMAITVLIALGASLGVAVFLMPVLAYLGLRWPRSQEEQSGHSQHEDTRFFSFCKRIYLPLLNYSLSHGRVLGGVVVALVLLGVGAALRLGTDFVPRLDEGDLVFTLSRNPKQGIDASIESQKKAEAVLRKYPEVQYVFSRIGTAEAATDPMGAYLADTFVILNKDRRVWRYTDKNDLATKMIRDLEAVDQDQDISATQPIEMRFNEILEGSRADVTLRILGPDLGLLMDFLQQAEAVLKRIPGVGTIEQDPLTSLKKSALLDVRADYAGLARYGVSLADLNRTVELAMSGRTVGSFFWENIRFPIRLHLDESLRNETRSIESIPVALPEGGTLPLSKLANISIQDRVTTIARVWGQRYAALSINLKNRDLDSFVHEAKAAIAGALVLPEGYDLYWGGQYKNLSRARAQLYFVIPAILCVVFFILYRHFRSLRHASLVFSSIPLATLGGVFALYLRGIPLSVSAAVGFIALIGIALLNAIVLMTVFHQLREQSPDMRLSEVVKQGALARLRPVLMTAFVASLGFLPMALNTGIGAEVQRPLATVVIGGLVSSTLLTLVLLPLVYLYIGETWGVTRADMGSGLMPY